MDDKILRYSKQIILDNFGVKAQSLLENSKVLVIGAGGLGSSVLYHLAAVGVGNIGIADFDTVTLSNLNRQIIHNTEDLGKKKTISAKEKISLLNPLVSVTEHSFRITSENITELLECYDIIIDATDNIVSRYLISDCAYFLKKPLVEGSAVSMEGFVFTIIPDKTACYRCLYPYPPKDNTLKGCADIGILGAVTGVVGSIMAIEAIKLIISTGENIINKILFFDGLSSSFENIVVEKNCYCPLCGKKEITQIVEYSINCKNKAQKI